MKKFSFPLDRVLAWRRLERDREQTVLQRLLLERNTLAMHEANIRRQRLEAERLLTGHSHIDSTHLATLANWQNSMKRAIASLKKDLAAADQKVMQQQSRCIETKRRVDLLERLREQRVTDWKTELSKEEEAFAAETFLYTQRSNTGG